MADMDELKRRAHEWVDRLNSGTGLEGSWRLQRIERRTKTAPGSGEPAGDLPVRIRRFAKGIPANLIDEAIQYLVKELSPYTGIVFNGTILEGRYVPTRTWWERDEQAVVDRGQARENTYTLYQDLSDADRFDEAVFSAGGSCSEEIEMRYEYERFSVESVPAGGQGVTYSVQAVSRNDDGTFDYAVVKRVAVTKHSEPAVVKCDDFEKVTVETWDNLYGEPDAWLDNRGVEDKTDPGLFSPVDLPMPCETEDGTLVEVTIRKNDDCTYSAVVQTTESKSVEPAQKSKQKSLRGVTETVVSRNVTDDTIPEVLELGERIEIERNPDGTVNRTHTFVSLEAVGDTGSTCQKTLFEHEHSDMTNVPDRPTAEVDPASGGVVHERTARATEEGTWDVVERTTTEQKVEGAQKSKQKTLRGVTVTTVDRNTEDGTIPDASAMGLGERVQVERTPGGLYNRTVTEVSPEAVGDTGSTCQKTLFEHEHSDMTNVPDRPTAEVDPASGGVVHERTARATEEGTWDVVERTTTEQKVEGAQKSKQKTLRGVTVTTVDRNTEDGTIPDASAMGLGERVQVERTPGGLYNRTVTEVSPEAVGDTGSTCQKTLFEHEHSDMTNVPDRPTAEVDAASGGVVHERTARATEEGTWDVVERTTTEQKVEGAQKSKQKTLRGVTVTTVDRNMPTGDIPETLELGERYQVERTPGNLYNVTHTEVAADSVGEIVHSCEKSGSVEHTDTTVVNQTDDVSGCTDDAPVNTVKRLQVRRTDEGTFDVETMVKTFTPVTTTSVSTWATETTTTTVTRHCEDINPTATLGEASSSPDDTGAATVTVTEVTATGVDSGWIKWDSETQTPNSKLKYHHGILVFRNRTKNWLEESKPTSGSNVTMNASVNKLGLFDGSIAYTDLYDWVTDGSGGGGGSEEGTYQFYDIRTDATGRRSMRSVTVPVVTYWGVGNDGSEGHSRANTYGYPGMHLPPRTYATASPVFGLWQWE